jgi:membrane protein implicated in regulation of membrane protease activity
VALIVALLLAVFVVPHPWGLVAVAVGALVEVGESLFWVRWSRRRRVQVGVETLIGEEGYVRAGGYVFVNGELWRAHGAEHLPPGTRVRILAVEGLALVVEPADRTESP